MNKQAPAEETEKCHICLGVRNSFKQNKTVRKEENKILGHLKWQSLHLLCMKHSLPAVS